MICSKITTTKKEKTRILKGFFSISNKTNEKKIRFPVIPKKLIKKARAFAQAYLFRYLMTLVKVVLTLPLSPFISVTQM